jgi:hypothetical protein
MDPRGDDEALGEIREAVVQVLASHEVPVGDGYRALGIFTAPRSSTRLRVLMDLEWQTGRVLGGAAARRIRSAGDLTRAFEGAPCFRREA